MEAQEVQQDVQKESSGSIIALVIFLTMVITGLSVYFIPKIIDSWSEDIKKEGESQGYVQCVNATISSVNYYGYVDVPLELDELGNVTKYMRLVEEKEDSITE